MRQLMHYMKQLNQRRTAAFYLLPSPRSRMPATWGHLSFAPGQMSVDTMRARREYSADAEYDADD